MLITQVSKALNKFSLDEWQTLIAGVQAVSADATQSIMLLLTKKQQIENFLGIDLIPATGWTFPNVIYTCFDRCDNIFIYLDFE